MLKRHETIHAKQAPIRAKSLKKSKKTKKSRPGRVNKISTSNKKSSKQQVDQKIDTECDEDDTGYLDMNDFIDTDSDYVPEDTCEKNENKQESKKNSRKANNPRKVKIEFPKKENITTNSLSVQ